MNGNRCLERIRRNRCDDERGVFCKPLESRQYESCGISRRGPATRTAPAETAVFRRGGHSDPPAEEREKRGSTCQTSMSGPISSGNERFPEHRHSCRRLFQRAAMRSFAECATGGTPQVRRTGCGPLCTCLPPSGHEVKVPGTSEFRKKSDDGGFMIDNSVFSE